MKLEFDPTNPADVSAAFKILNALKDKAGNATTAAAPTPAPTTAAPAPSPAPAAPPPTAASSTSPAAPPPPSGAPAPAPAASAPPPTPPAPEPAGGMTQASLSALIGAYAKVHTPKGCKARFAQLAEAFAEPTWTSISNIPAARYEDVAPWFAVE